MDRVADHLGGALMASRWFRHGSYRMLGGNLRDGEGRAVPFTKQIADVDVSIENVRTMIELLRSRKLRAGDKQRLDTLLVELARLKAERLRLLDRQRLSN